MVSYLFAEAVKDSILVVISQRLFFYLHGNSNVSVHLKM